MSDNVLTPDYWNRRYEQHNTPWDIGYASPPIIRYLDALPDRSLRILIPGAGSAYEAVYAHQQGFGEVYVCDWASAAFEHLRAKAPDFPEAHLLVEDFFQLSLEVDLILEQTFFSAILRAQRHDYARQAARLLASGGKVAGLLFAQPFEQEGPPFGGTAEEYRRIFEPYFHVLQMDISLNSIAPRSGRELFFELQKRSFPAN